MPKMTWGHLTLIKEGRDPIIAEGPNGPYETGEFTAQWMLLECACGYKFRIWKRNFPGRRVMRSCPNLECSARGKPTQVVHRGRPRIEEAGAMYTIYVKPSLMAEVRQFQREEKLRTTSAAVRLLLRSGLTAMVARKNVMPTNLQDDEPRRIAR